MARNTKIIREVKYVKALTPQHIRKTIKKYQYPFFPDRIEIIIPGRKRTCVPEKTREYAKKKKVKIRRFWGFG